ncbi:DNA polymerase IV [Acidithiobacillus ferrivorans]|uniref:DNA polymerase IV n=1 Tax=Acidithiobacillus ferrivorans TaxID=160808 RepID=UPI001C07782B|nr:DNA polymerase IV [Acidithiobacillus ferrivorans]MBU2849929.1 DNA polymerase IV [Acidithiobacillus ferrivorans]
MAMPDPLVRKIIHIDMDAFFAAVEERDDSMLKDRPVIVGGDPNSRGVVATCNYAARRFGIHSAMTASRAKVLCPDAVFVRPRMEVYREVSRQVMGVLRSVTPQVEPLSLDEAYLDVTELLLPDVYARDIARDIQRKITLETDLTASAGVSYNKLLAKLASDWRKPNGLMVIPPERGADFLAELPVRKLHGIGPSTAAKMEGLNIHKVSDLRVYSRQQLVVFFGKVGSWYHDVSHGIDHRPVEPFRKRQSVGYERTFPEDLCDPAEIRACIYEMADKAIGRLQVLQSAGKTVTLKIRLRDFRTITRSRSIAGYVQNRSDLDDLLPWLMEKTITEQPVRLLGVTISSLVSRESLPPEQIALGL